MEILKYVILLILLGCFVYMIYMIYYMFKTMCIGILFEGEKILVPFLHKKYPFILDIIQIIFLIIGINFVGGIRMILKEQLQFTV